MSREPLPYSVGDVSALARSLRRQLGGFERIPGHLEMLNLLAKAGGYRNYQHLRAQAADRAALDAPRTAPQPADLRLVRRAARHFDADGRLVRWPKKHSLRLVCLWVLWARIAPRRALSEAEINDLLEARHLFGDHALLRRWLVDSGMVERTADGRSYTRVERRPPAEAVELLRHLRG